MGSPSATSTCPWFGTVLILRLTGVITGSSMARTAREITAAETSFFMMVIPPRAVWRWSPRWRISSHKTFRSRNRTAYESPYSASAKRPRGAGFHADHARAFARPLCPPGAHRVPTRSLHRTLRTCWFGSALPGRGHPASAGNVSRANLRKNFGVTAETARAGSEALLRIHGWGLPANRRPLAPYGGLPCSVTGRRPRLSQRAFLLEYAGAAGDS